MADDSTDLAALEAEHRGMSDRDLMLKTLALIRAQNGKLAQHDDDLYGNTARGIRGAKPLAEAHEIAIDRGRTTIRTVVWLLGVIGVGNIVAVLTFLGRT